MNSISLTGFELTLRLPVIFNLDSVLPERTLSNVVLPHPNEC